MAERIGTLRWVAEAGGPTGIEQADREEFEL